MPIFYQPKVLNGHHFLDEEESKHCVKVLRLKEGMEIEIIDGLGNLCLAKIVVANPKKVEFSILQMNEEAFSRNFKINMAVAPTKSIDRFEWFIEKATEFGVDAIYPILCKNSERAKLNTDRLNRVALAAIKQSKKAMLPKIHDLISYNDYLESISQSVHNQLFIAHCRESKKHHLENLMKPGREYHLIIGPEGDFTSDEIKKAGSMGFESVTLGPYRLRTETAAIAGCHLLNFLNNSI